LGDVLPPRSLDHGSRSRLLWNLIVLQLKEIVSGRKLGTARMGSRDDGVRPGLIAVTREQLVSMSWP
jgi:hypothetical protein